MKHYTEITNYGKKVRVQCVCGKKHTIKRKNLDRYKCSCESVDLKAGIYPLFNRYKKGALSRGYKFKLNQETFKHIVQSNCFYCGTKPSQKSGSFIYNGIDRMDNSKGYIDSNVISCCGKCNKAKGTMCMSEFVLHCKSVYDQINKMKESDKTPIQGLYHRFKHGVVLKAYHLYQLLEAKLISKDDIKYDYRKESKSRPESSHWYYKALEQTAQGKIPKLTETQRLYVENLILTNKPITVAQIPEVI